MGDNSQFRTRSTLLLYGMAALLAAVSLFRVLLKTSDLWNIDFHSYWYAGHFVWQSHDPYSSSLNAEEPFLPVQYWDGVTHSSGSLVHHPQSSKIPGITAPALLLISTLSRFSWPTAVRLWIIINMTMLVAIAWACARFFGFRFWSMRGTFILFVLTSLISTREAIETGQSTLFILGFVILSLAAVDYNQIIGGGFLGIGLSKFTLAFPAFLILLIRRKLMAAIICGGVQVGGTALLARVSNKSLFDLIGSYYQILMVHTGLPGMHLAQGLLKSRPLLQIMAAGVGIIAISIILLRHWQATGLNETSAETRIRTWTLLTAVMMLNLLTLYHRRYDFTAGILLLALLVFTINSPHEKLWSRSKHERNAIVALSGLVAGIWILPLYLLIDDRMYVSAYNIASIAAFGICVWMHFRITQVSWPGVGPRSISMSTQQRRAPS